MADNLLVEGLSTDAQAEAQSTLALGRLRVGALEAEALVDSHL